MENWGLRADIQCGRLIYPPREEREEEEEEERRRKERERLAPVETAESGPMRNKNIGTKNIVLTKDDRV